MGTYLLKASLVWLLSLVLFELLFRKETVHAWNRAYLAGTLVLGLVLPLVSWSRPAAAIVPELRIPLQVLAGAGGAAAAQAPPAAGNRAGSWPAWWQLVYLAGLATGIFFLMRTGWQLLRIYRASERRAWAGYRWRLTDRAHSPFSFFSLIFLPRSARFSDEELLLVLGHERRHVRLLHSVDAVAMQLVKLVLWFHPLVHWYHFRLRLVHEYQADGVSAERPGNYGRFLIEQALLQPPFPLVHSFFHSPLKNRIAMLTRKKSAGLRLGRYLMVAPLLVAALFCCTKQRSARAQGHLQDGDTAVVFNGRTVILGTKADIVVLNGRDTAYARDASAALGPVARSIDGVPVFRLSQVDRRPRYQGPESGATAALFAALRPALDGLDDGAYMIYISNVVVDGQGKIAYYQTSGIRASVPFDRKGDSSSAEVVVMLSGSGQEQPEVLYHTGGSEPQVPVLRPEQMASLDRALADALQDRLRFKPAYRNGKAVSVLLEHEPDLVSRHRIIVKNHRARLETYF